jgi:hypothetical protein
MTRIIFTLLLILVAAACSSTVAYVATDARVAYDAAEQTCREIGGHVAPLERVDEVLEACRGAGETGPCWVALSSSEANYAITIDGHLWAVPLDSTGEALAICEVR